MIPVKVQYPDRHARYLVLRRGHVFTATPCYGMHAPWWVPQLLVDDEQNREGEPVPMLEPEQWIPVPPGVSRLAPQ